MLNENYEYKQYTDELNDQYICTYGKRLMYDTLKSNLSGLSRPMKIIAREKIFHENMDVMSVKKYLEEWFGKKWLVNYIEQIFPFDLKGTRLYNDKQIGSIRDKVISKIAEYKNDSFCLGADPSNDFYQIHFDRMVAEAMNQGELSQYYLVADCADKAEGYTGLDQSNDFYEEYVFEGVVKPTATKEVELCGKKRNDINPTQYRNDVLMMVSVYLLNTNQFFENSSVFSPTDYANWRSKKNENSRFLDYYYANNKLMNNEPAAGNNIRKIVIEKSWLDKCHWILMKKEQLLETLNKNKNTLFYRDYYYGNGSGSHQDFSYGQKVGLVKREIQKIAGGKLIVSRESFYRNELEFWQNTDLLYKPGVDDLMDI